MGLIRDPEFHPPGEKSIEPTPSVGTSPLAVISLVFGILAYTALPLLGALIAVVAGHVARGQIREEGGRLGGKALAKAGLVLGYVQLGLVAAVMAGIGLLLVPAVRHIVHLDPFDLDAPPRYFLQSGVKMLNEMDRNDFGMIEAEKLASSDAEIIGSYVANSNSFDTELALLTTKELVYYNTGHVTRFELSSIRQVNLPKTTEPFGPYEIEVERESGAIMRIKVRPPEAGPSFGKAIESAVKRAKGGGSREETRGGATGF